jgi:light-regulated signal transduction histidine kinase (bacteriophytochrome)
MLLVPFATIADAVLDAVFFGEGSIRDQLFSPTLHEVSIRILFSTFILAAIYLGMHYLANTAQKEGALQQNNKDLGLTRQDLEELQDDLIRQLRNTSSELETSIELFKAHSEHTFSEKSQFFMESIYNTSNRLNEQLEVCLAHTELPSSELRRERVKLDQLALDVVEELRLQQPHRQIEFDIQPWINGWCDKKMLRLVIHNLFVNAMSSIPQSRQGKVEFGMFNRNGQKVFFVRDNGTGFSATQAKRLFEVFRDNSLNAGRPDSSSSLASARRIIHRHGGQIWAEGIQDVGGTIFFTYNSP